MTSSNPLPSTRTFLTSLISTLTGTPHPPQAPTSPSQQPFNEPYPPADQPSNPFKSLTQAQKALLSTLHVLFPPPMLLMALDLLDRGCVVRVVQREGHVNSESSDQKEKTQVTEGQQTGSGGEQLPSSSHPLPHLSSSPPAPTSAKSHPVSNTLYLVRSLQPPKSRFSTSLMSGSAGGTGAPYTVRLNAWNCTCAAFAFSCFPGGGSYSSTFAAAPWNVDPDEDFPISRGEDVKGIREENDWEFGGLSLDGKSGEVGEGGDGNVPLCKHLLACLLGERWDGVLGGYVKERVVDREEMAGYAAEA